MKSGTRPATILSFDVEEHFRIEAACAVGVDAARRRHYAARLDSSTSWLLDRLAERNLHATFFVVGQIARSHPRLVARIAQLGHEVASNSWDHRRVHHHTPQSFREDLRLSRTALEQVTGLPVVGYRAPTFSIVTQTAWALDVLAEMEFAYDSSIFPVRHDRYGMPHAPRGPFRARGHEHEILELPPATWRFFGVNVPVGGGGYFRLLPRFFMREALRQTHGKGGSGIAMLYFHPWEFDPGQARLPLGTLNRFRTYVGIARARARLRSLLTQHHFRRAMDVAKDLDRRWHSLPGFAACRP